MTSRTGPAGASRIAFMLVVAVLWLAACGDDDDGGESAATPTVPTEATPATMFDGALWPDPATATQASTPAEVARSFVKDLVGMPDPALGEFQQGDSRSGEISLLLVGEDGRVRTDTVLATIALRQLDGERWFVIAAFSDDVRIDAPQALDEIASPVRITGRGRGFEANLAVSVHAAFEREPLVEDGTPAGDRERRPFAATLAFERPRTATGAIVVRDGGGLDGVASAFAAVPVRFAGG